MTKPTAKVIAHSKAPNGEELITFEIELHRFILPEHNTHRCLEGGTELWFDLPKARSSSDRRLFKMTIEDFYLKWTKGAKGHRVGSTKDVPCDWLEDSKKYTAKELSSLLNYSVGGIRTACREGRCEYLNKNKKRSEDFIITGSSFKKWREDVGKRSFSLNSRLSRMKLRMLNEDTNTIENTNITDIWLVGEKDTYTVTAGEYKVTGTEDHPLLTKDGWKEIKDITEDDFIITCQVGRRDYSDPNKHKNIEGKWTTVWNRKNKLKVFENQEGKCNYCKEALNCEDSFDIHHIKPVHSHPELAFCLGNVVGVHKKCHKKLHSIQGWQGGNELVGKAVKVDNITYSGKQKVYDLSVSSHFHNFIANGVVVHNCLSRNFQSSRAVPVLKQLEQIANDPAMPVYWGKNQAGMVAQEELEGSDKELAEMIILTMRDACLNGVKQLQKLGLHKQIANRYVEPWMWTKGVVTTTKEAFEMFFALRSHKDAQPEIKALSDAMKEALEQSVPKNLNYGDYHTPYFSNGVWNSEHPHYTYFGEADDGSEDSRVYLEEAIKISTSCCAQVSYRVLDDSLEKALKVYDMLNLPENGKYKEDPPHFSPCEHIAKVVEQTTKDRDSGNFHSNTFWQYRKALEIGKEDYFIK